MIQEGESELNILVIDTSSSMTFISVRTNEGVSTFYKDTGNSHSSTLFANLDNLLQERNISIRDISLIAAGLGPGSFTGIRIAVTTCRMLAQILDIPLLGIPTHLLYAASADLEPGSDLAIALDAKKNRVFGALYRITENPLQPEEITEPGDYNLEYLYKGCGKTAVFSTGNGIEKYFPGIENKPEKHTVLKDFTLSGERITSLVREIYSKNKEYCDIYRIIPLYKRKSDAEIAKGF